MRVKEGKERQGGWKGVGMEVIERGRMGEFGGGEARSAGGKRREGTKEDGGRKLESDEAEAPRSEESCDKPRNDYAWVGERVSERRRRGEDVTESRKTKKTGRTH